MFLFKSRLLVCKVRRISDERSVFVLRDIIKLPDCQIVDQPSTSSFDIQPKSPATGPLSLQRFIAHSDEAKSRWLREIAQYVNDPLALHEHTVDDLRIDPTQVKSDTDGEAFKLPKRIDAHEPDSVNPAEVAHDHYLPNTQKKIDAELAAAAAVAASAVAAVAASSVAISQTAAKIETKASSVAAAATTITEQKEIKLVEEKHSKLTRSSAVKSQDQSSPVETKAEKYIVTEPSKSSEESVKSVEPKTTGITTVSALITPSSLSAALIASESFATTTAAAPNNQIALIPAFNPIRESSPHRQTHRVQQTVAIVNSPQDGDQDNRTVANAPQPTSASGSGGGGGGWGGDQPQYETIYRFNFGDRHQLGARGGGGGRPPPERSNLPDFLIPPQLITYETTFEIDIRKIRAASPPPRPKFVKKFLVHTESLERKTRAFLTGNYDVGGMSADDSLRNARQKIRSLKTTLLQSDDEVKHAEDTIENAKSGKFLNIYNPRLGVEKPLYEFVEVAGDKECAGDFGDDSRRGRRQQQQSSTTTSTEQAPQSSNNMSEYSSSRYSSRSSRKSKIEGI